MSKHPGAKPKSKRPSSRSYENLKVTVNNPFTVAKLQFFSFFACVLQPFLKSYETDDPMIPFLYKYIFSLLQQIITVVVKHDLLINCKDFGGLMKLDLDKKNRFMELERYEYWVFNLIYNYQAQRQTRWTTIKFHLFTMVFFNSFQILQIEKSPMSYNLVRIQWSLILTSCLSKMWEFYNQSLKKLKLFQPQICDSVMQEFLEFVGLNMKLHSDVIESFKRCKTNLDILFFSYTDIVKYKELSSLARAVFFS